MFKISTWPYQLHGQFLLHASPGCPGWTAAGGKGVRPQRVGSRDTKESHPPTHLSPTKRWQWGRGTFSVVTDFSWMFYVGPAIYFYDTQDTKRLDPGETGSTQPFGTVLPLVHLNFRNQTHFSESRKAQQESSLKFFLDNPFCFPSIRDLGRHDFWMGNFQSM